MRAELARAPQALLLLGSRTARAAPGARLQACVASLHAHLHPGAAAALWRKPQGVRLSAAHGLRTLVRMSGEGDGLADAAKVADGGSDGSGYRPEAPSQDVVPWMDRIQVSSTRARKVRGGNYVQLATVTPEGLPRNRTVVFRGWVTGADGRKAMKMITDNRSEKVGHVAASPACEMVWWFAKSSEQYRVAGELELVGPDHKDAELLAQRKQTWGNLSDPAREQFFWESPGVPFSGAPAPPAGGRDEEGAVLTGGDLAQVPTKGPLRSWWFLSETCTLAAVLYPSEPLYDSGRNHQLPKAPDTFLLMLLWPKEVKYLRLTDNFAQNDVMDSTGAWSSSHVNP